MLVERSDPEPGIAVIRLNDPGTRNAMSEAMATEFSGAVAALSKDSSVRVAILTGAGEAFSGGGHLEMLLQKTKLSRDENRELMLRFYDQFLSIINIPVPVIAALNGHAMGAGICLALACDLRIASDNAKLGFNFVHLGLHPGMGATYFLPRVVGQARAKELLYSGKIVTAAQALALGLVNDVSASMQFWESTMMLARGIAAAGPHAVRALKVNLGKADGISLQECLTREAEAQAANYVSAEFLEGINAAREKRKPRFC